MIKRQLNFVLCLFFLTTVCFGQITVTGEIIAADGDIVAGSTISSINNPLTNEAGEVGFPISLSNNDRGYWNGNSVLHLNSSDPALSGIEGFSGNGNNGNFIISSSYNGSDAVYDQNGLIAKEDTQAVGFANGVNTTFHSRPFKLGENTAYWIAGLNFTGGTNSEERVLYKLGPGGMPTPVYFTSGFNLLGLEVDYMDFDYYVSDNDDHMIHVLGINTASSVDDNIVVLNGNIVVAREASPSTVAGHNWDNFDHLCINNNGDYLFSGDTDGPSTEDEFIALNGVIMIQEGDVLDGISLTSLSIRNLSINDFGKIGFVLQANGVEHFFESDINDIVGNANLIVSTGDFIDVNTDAIGDFEIDDFNASSGISLDLSEHNFAFLELDITAVNGGASLEAIVKLNLDCPDLITINNGSGDINSSIPVYAEADTITASNIINSGANVGYDASTEINLLAGFEVGLGVLFEARIDGCGNLSGPID